MGMTTTATGRITITPPLTHGEVQETSHLGIDTDPCGMSDAYLEVVTDTVTTPDGDLVTQSAVAIRASEHEKLYDLLPHIQHIVECYPDRTFDGFIHLLHEEGEQARVYVRDDTVFTVTPEIVWPDEATLAPPDVPEDHVA